MLGGILAELAQQKHGHALIDITRTCTTEYGYSLTDLTWTLTAEVRPHSDKSYLDFHSRSVAMF